MSEALMRRQVWVRKYNEQTDGKLFLDWLYANRDENRFDPDIFKKKQVTIFTCFDESGIVGFIPVCVALAVESLAWRPGLSPEKRSLALKSFQQTLVYEASKMNCPYAFMSTIDPYYVEFVTRYGWKEAEVPVLSLRFSDLEPSEEK